jgi:hypothetical protein
MEIQITKCANSGYWYNEHIGKCLELEYVDRFGDYWCRELDEYHALNFVLKNDAILVKS